MPKFPVTRLTRLYPRFQLFLTMLASARPVNSFVRSDYRSFAKRFSCGLCVLSVFHADCSNDKEIGSQGVALDCLDSRNCPCLVPFDTEFGQFT